MNQDIWSDVKAKNKEDWFKLEKLLNEVAQKRELAVCTAFAAAMKPSVKQPQPSTSTSITSTKNSDGLSDDGTLYKVWLTKNHLPKLCKCCQLYAGTIMLFFFFLFLCGAKNDSSPGLLPLVGICLFYFQFILVFNGFNSIPCFDFTVNIFYLNLL